MDNGAENSMTSAKKRIKIAVYGHGGSQNHGNEAIVRGIREIFPDADMALDELHRKFKNDPRVHYVEEHGAPQQKYIISKCRAFVVTRTHAAIAGLGSKVPVVITGYKTKSRGIAADIFQGNFDVTADVQSLNSEHDVSDKLFGVLENEERIRKFYEKRMPEYFAGLELIRELILSLH